MPSLRVQSTGDTIYFEGVASERFAHSADVTDHPVENRQNVSDHRQQMPLRITVEGIITGHPLIHDNGRLVRGIDPEAAIFGDPVTTFGNARLLEAVRFFEANEDELVEYVSARTGVRRDLFIESFSYDIDNEERIVFEIELLEIIFGRSEIVDLPPVRRRTTEPEVTIGDEEGEPVEDEIEQRTLLRRGEDLLRGN